MWPEPAGPRGTLVYLSGAPGVGKSTLMSHLTRACPRDTVMRPFAHDILHLPPTSPAVPPGTAVELGRRREKFSGTDALSMSVIGPALEWMVFGPPRGTLVLAEGDRLGNTRFLTTTATLGYAVTLIHLTAPPDLLDARCDARGSTQSTNWRTGRATKAARLADTAQASGVPVVRLDTRNTVECLSVSLADTVPALRVLFPSHFPEA